METLLRRWSWLPEGAIIAIAAIVAANAAARWLPQSTPGRLTQHLMEEYLRSEEETPAKKIDAILRRNIFCSDRESFAPETAAAPVVEGRAPRPTSDRAPAGVAPSLREGVVQLGERRYELQRRALEASLGNLNQLAKEVNVLPEVVDGKPAGLRIVGVRSGSIFAALGLRNGDVIRAINGLDLDSPDRAMEAYLQVRAASHISIAAERGGGRINLEYDIR